MTDVEMLGIVIAVGTGSAGFVMALFAWQLYRGAPFGRALILLLLFMATFTVYHAGLAVWGTLPGYALLPEALLFGLVVVFMIEMVRLHYKHLRVPES